jgi:hypothetical protein
LATYFRKITLAALTGSLDLWRKHNAHNEALGNAHEPAELILDADGSLYMEEGELVTQEEIRNGVNLIAQLVWEEVIVREDMVEITMLCRGQTSIKTQINKNATDEMLENRAQREWGNIHIQLARSGLAPIRRPMRAGTTIHFEEIGSTPSQQTAKRHMREMLN